MEFDELKKIWDTQNNRPMYAINEEALHRRIHSHNRGAARLADINEIALIIIAIGTAAMLIVDEIMDDEGIYSYVGALSFIFIAVFIFLSRRNRKKSEGKFDQSMLGELEHAITNAGYLVKFSGTFMWWFLIPAAIFSYPNMAIHHAPWHEWLLVSASFALSYLVVRWELKKKHLPRLRRLEGLRDRLTNPE